MKEKSFELNPMLGIKTGLTVGQERMAATIPRRTEPGWQHDVIEGPGSTPKPPGIGAAIPLERIYERTIAGARASDG